MESEQECPTVLDRTLLTSLAERPEPITDITPTDIDTETEDTKNVNIAEDAEARTSAVIDNIANTLGDTRADVDVALSEVSNLEEPAASTETDGQVHK
jgi:hypothetical protein